MGHRKQTTFELVEQAGRPTDEKAEPKAMSDLDSDENEVFSAISKAYKNNPSLEHYVKLRRDNPKEEIEVAILGGMDPLFFMEPELKRYGFDPMLVAGAMDSDRNAISELSLQLMESIIKARTLSKSGRTHLARRGLVVPDKLIDWLIGVMLDSLSWNDNLHIPRDLIVLIRERLSGSNPHYQRAMKERDKRGNVAWVVAELMAKGIRPSIRRIGLALGVAPSTVMRWYAPGEFKKALDRLMRGDERGEPGRPVLLRKGSGKPLREK
jgi:hypothetical protein